MWPLIRSMLFQLDPELAHHVGSFGLKTLPFFKTNLPLNDRFEFCGRKMISPLGIAAGFDKDATMIPALSSLGFGFVEVGSVTPLPQPGNPKPRIFRLANSRALINRMGFNSAGADVVRENLKNVFQQRICPVGVNLGKNRATALEDAASDYEVCLEKLYEYSDYIVVNLSSPNTPGLTDLQSVQFLRPLLARVREQRDKCFSKHAGDKRDLFLKISPDLDLDSTNAAVDLALEAGFAGIIATNTTQRRDLPAIAANEKHLNEAGGLSGAPLSELSVPRIQQIRSQIGKKAKLISVGGLKNEQDALERIEAGADFLQVYTEFIYSGPSLARKVAGAFRN